jgi:hypothetical protein
MVITCIFKLQKPNPEEFDTDHGGLTIINTDQSPWPKATNSVIRVFAFTSVNLCSSVVEMIVQ